MALDRFIDWNTEAHPTAEQVRMVCEDFLGGVGHVSWSRECGRWVIDLPGVDTSPYRRARPEIARPYGIDDRRQIEVYMHDEEFNYSLDVITRHADEFTNGLAARLAEELARGWDGKVRK